jgi:AraC-like DNA-binding protein
LWNNEMLLGTPLYAPTILYSQARMRSGRNLKKRQKGGPFNTWQPGIYRLIMVEEGSHEVDIVGQTFTANHGDIYLLQPGCLRWVTTGTGSLAKAVGFIVARVPGSDLVHENGHAYCLKDVSHQQPSPEAVWGQPLPHLLSANCVQGIRDDLTQLVSIAWRDPWQRAEADHLLGRILWRIATEVHSPAPRSQPKAPLMRPSDTTQRHWLDGIENLIDQHLADIRTTTDLARRVGVSTDHFARIFKQAFHCSPSQFLRQRRLQETARQLSNSDANLERIARFVGYRDATALAHAWQDAHGISPGRWRRERRHLSHGSDSDSDSQEAS